MLYRGVMGRNRYIVSDDHGTPYGEYTDRDIAVEALRDLIDADPAAVHDCFIVVLGEHGERVETISPDPPTLRSGAPSPAGAAYLVRWRPFAPRWESQRLMRVSLRGSRSGSTTVGYGAPSARS